MIVLILRRSMSLKKEIRKVNVSNVERLGMLRNKNIVCFVDLSCRSQEDEISKLSKLISIQRKGKVNINGRGR